jgi:hypothetical protein
MVSAVVLVLADALTVSSAYLDHVGSCPLLRILRRTVGGGGGFSPTFSQIAVGKGENEKGGLAGGFTPGFAYGVHIHLGLQWFIECNVKRD